MSIVIPINLKSGNHISESHHIEDLAVQVSKGNLKVNELEDEVKHLKKRVQKLEKANEDQKLIQQKETTSFLNATTNILKMNAKGKIFLEKNNIRDFFSDTMFVHYFQVFIAVKTITTKVSIAQDTTTCIQGELQL